MWDRIKDLLHHFVNVLMMLFVAALGVLYLGTASVLLTSVINDLRLDTYVTVDTGFGIIMLWLLLVWTPLWATRLLRPHHRP